MKLYIFLSFAIVTVFGDADSSFRNFIAESMSNFGEWIADQGLDPTPPLDREFSMNLTTGLFRINGTLKDVSLTGLSKKHSDLHHTDTSFMNNRIEFYIYPEWAGISGTYHASGSILDMHPIGGDDTWSVASDPLQIRFTTDFRLENGFIVLGNEYGTSVQEFSFTLENMNAVFNNLFTPETIDFVDDVTTEIASRLNYYVFGYGGEHVLLFDVHIKNYLQSLFSVTPASEIISWPDPTTTPGPTTTTTTLMPTTTQWITTTPPTAMTTTPTIPTTTPWVTTTPPTTTTSIPCANKNTAAEIRSEGLNNFLVFSFRNFGEWLIENGLDPTLPITAPANINIDSSFLWLNGTFRYTTALGLSRNTHFRYPESDFIVPQFNFRMEMVNLTIYGLYLAEGTIISTYPISGEGMWTLSNFNLVMNFHISGFGIEDGFININQYDERTISLHPDTSRSVMSMPDLIKPDDTHGFGQEVLDVLKDVIPSELNLQDKHPVAHAVVGYLDAIFSETPLSEIIATTRPPGCV